MLSREQFLSAARFGSEDIDVPGLGTVKVRVMSAGDRDRFEEVSAKTPHKDFRARLVVATVCDAEGNLLFASADVDKVSALPVDVIDPIVTAAVRVNKMRPEDSEEVRKNSESAPGSASAPA